MSFQTAKKFLDRNARICPEPDAILLSQTFQEGSFPNTQQVERLQPYLTRLKDATETEAAKRKATPLSTPLKHGEEKEVQGYSFQWNGKHWRFTSPVLDISVEPQTDEEDLNRLLACLRPIEGKILSRGIGKEKIHIEIGCPQWDTDKSVAAASLHTENLLWFPQTEKTEGRLMATCLEKAGQDTPISLSGIIFHEIGHLLEPHFTSELLGLQSGFTSAIPKMGEIFKKVSPNYLASQMPEVQRMLEKIESLLSQGISSARVKGNPTELEPLKNKIREQTTRELLAECIRAIYLEPCLGENPPKITKTGWFPIDNLTDRLQQELKKTLQGTKGSIIGRREINLPIHLDEIEP